MSSRLFVVPATTIASALVLAACGTGQSPPQAQRTADGSSTTVITPSASKKASPIKTGNGCTDATGDATINDLTSVKLKRDGDFLQVTWTMAKRDTGVGTAGFFVGIASEDGSAAGQLGVKYLDGRQMSYFTFRDTNKEISDAARVTATSVTGSFPMSELDQYGPNFTWAATTTRDGNDVDSCPDNSGDIYNPANLRFAG